MGNGITAFLTLLGWLWFAFLVFVAGLALTKGAPLAGACYAVCGGMAWPPLWRWLAARDTSFPRNYRIAVGIAAFVAAVALEPHVAPKAKTGPINLAPADPVASSVQRDVASEMSADERLRAQAAAAKVAGLRNKAKIASLLADVKTLGERDYEGRLIFWKEITALAPDNAEYARKKQELVDQLAKLDYLRANPEQGMVVESIRPRKEGFGNVLVVDITLRNDSLSNLKDFHITCESSGHSGTVMDSNTRILYETVEARSTRTFRKLNMGFLNSQAASTHCVVDEASIA